MTPEELIEKKVENFEVYNEVLILGSFLVFILLVYILIVEINED